MSDHHPENPANPLSVKPHQQKVGEIPLHPSAPLSDMPKAIKVFSYFVLATFISLLLVVLVSSVIE